MSQRRCAGGCGRAVPWHDDARCEDCEERVAALRRGNGPSSASRPAEVLDGLERRMTAVETDIEEIKEVLRR